MKEVLETIKNIWVNEKLVMVFQPHRYSRTAEHFNQFIDILKNVDQLVLMDIYAASEKPLDNINSEEIVGEIKKYNKNVILINKDDELSKYLDKIIENKNVLLTMGAGNISRFVNYYKKYLIQ